MFLIIFNEIDESVLNSYVVVFADVTRITKAFKNEKDAEVQQEDRESLYEWARKNILFQIGSFVAFLA